MEENTDQFKLDVLKVDYAEYKTQLTKKFNNRKPFQRVERNKIIAFISGTINHINVRKGSRVNEGDQLLILEAMKMRNQILAPIDGKISKIHVKKGDAVAKNQLLIEIT